MRRAAPVTTLALLTVPVDASAQTPLPGSPTWITGTATVPTVSGSGACGASTIKIKRFFQCRGTNTLLKTITSNIVSDSRCVPFE